MTALKVVRGKPDAEELAALVAVLASIGEQAPPTRPQPAGAWNKRNPPGWRTNW